METKEIQTALIGKEVYLFRHDTIKQVRKKYTGSFEIDTALGVTFSATAENVQALINEGSIQVPVGGTFDGLQIKGFGKKTDSEKQNNTHTPYTPLHEVILIQEYEKFCIMEAKSVTVPLNITPAVRSGSYHLFYSCPLLLEFLQTYKIQYRQFANLHEFNADIRYKPEAAV